MAPKTATRRERDNDFSAVGKIGRRTGVTLPQGRLDDNGLEEITGIFSSPRKPSPLFKSIHVSEIAGGQSGVGMTPTRALSSRRSLRGASLPRSASPKKTGIGGTARRSNGVDLFAGEKDLIAADPEDHENTPVLTPTHLASNAPRRFIPSPEKSPLRDITGGAASVPKAGKGTGKARVPTSEPEEVVNKGSDIYDQAVLDVQEVPAVATQFDDGHVNVAAMEDEEPAEDVEELPLPDRELFDDEDVDQTFEPQSDLPVEEPTPAKANSRRKRKSDAVHAPSANVSSPLVKRPRKEMPSSKPVPSIEKPVAPELPANRAPPEAKTAPRMSRQQEKELSQVIEKVRARPGPPKSLYILRRETPADDNMVHTRSGRVSVKPLAYWRNERCVYGGSPGGANLHDGARFPLNSIKEIIRIEEQDASWKSKAKKKGKKGKKSAGRASAASDSEEDSSREDPEAEPWETAVGIFRGPVSVWDAQQQAPLDREEEIDLAYAPASIQTREPKKGATFKYAKLLSTSFFGTGIVDLPPGGLKNPKNSRRMHMSFFVVKGRVTVQVGPLGGEQNTFSVGKGGFWQVPRGNQYSIENESPANAARMFFSQGCEPVLEDE